MSEVEVLNEVLNGDRLHMTIFRRLEAMLDNPNEHGIYPTTEFMVGLKEDFTTLALEVAGGAGGVCLQENPGYVMPTEKLIEVVERVLADA